MTGPAVRRRHVFFLGGFDPKGAAHYHALYVREARLQGLVTGLHYEVGARERRDSGNSCWTVQLRDADGEVHTTYEYVRWDDIVRAHWPRRAWDVLAASVATYWMVLCSGQLAKVRRAAPRTLIPLAVPALFWLAVGLAAIGVAALAAAAGGTPLLGAAGALLGAAAVLRAAVAWERRLNTTWLLRIYRFVQLRAEQRVPGLEPRLDALAQEIRARLREPRIDEVLLVGFSVGSILAASAAARTVGRDAPDLDKLALLTLGQCIPLLGLMPAAAAFRAELRTLAQEPRIGWLDFSSPTDWGSFALVDPLALCLAGTAAAPGAPCLASPRFHRLFAPPVYRALRRDKRRMHLQYLMAGELAGGYDYFEFTAGGRNLRSRMTRGAG